MIDDGLCLIIFLLFYKLPRLSFIFQGNTWLYKSHILDVFWEILSRPVLSRVLSSIIHSHWCTEVIKWWCHLTGTWETEGHSTAFRATPQDWGLPENFVLFLPIWETAIIDWDSKTVLLLSCFLTRWVPICSLVKLCTSIPYVSIDDSSISSSKEGWEIDRRGVELVLTGEKYAITRWLTSLEFSVKEIILWIMW
jgi:hypothetical protein